MAGTESKKSPVPHHILVIDDEGVVCLSCSRILTAEGYSVECRQEPRDGLEVALSGEYDIVLLDVVMPEMSGLDVLKELKAAGVSSEIVIITGYSTVQTAVEAMKLGAADYISKPFTPGELVMVVQKVLERSALMRENVELRKKLESKKGFEGIIGESPSMERVFKLVQRVAPTHGTVLITGESGTGKEMIAKAIHNLSARQNKPFLAFDCSSLAPSLIESELFGHVKGSFSGAISTKQGLFEVADKGTLFLDEVANISLETQGKLLRVLETQKVKKVGDTVEHQVDIRIIAATNRDLQKMVAEGTFREDLFYRLNVIPIHAPPLRERTGDIPLLAMTFLERYRDRYEFKAKSFSPQAMRLMEAHAWLGNVRELKNVVERIAIMCESEIIEPHHLPPEMRHAQSTSSSAEIPDTWEELKDLKRRVSESVVGNLECRFVIRALERSQGNVTKAAENVGMQRTNFHALMRKYRLTSDGSDMKGPPRAS
ncbi:MAG: sigma-54-dependent Fis family transcriptional regulator [Candidatus Eiseniibacteriota bacterium]|nr:MAG: sigma-54-dependent Fis family transcriptional regulator [Candidatus Eisenbacteria bacterium]